VGGLAEDSLNRALFDNRAEIHEGDIIAHITDDAEVVGDEQVGEMKGALEVDEEVEHLRLYGDIQSGGGFVEDEELGTEDDGAGDAAMPMRWRWPPLNSWGKRLVCSGFRPTRRIISRTCSSKAAPEARLWM